MQEKLRLQKNLGAIRVCHKTRLLLNKKIKNRIKSYEFQRVNAMRDSTQKPLQQKLRLGKNLG